MKTQWIAFGVLINLNCHAQNIAVIDDGVDASYYARYDSLIRSEACFSEYADDGIITDGVFSNTEGIRYRKISVCKSGNSSQTGYKTSILPRDVPSEKYNSTLFYTTLP